MGLTEEHGKALNEECSEALQSVFKKVKRSHPDSNHAKVVMGNCWVALRYLEQINQVGIVGYSPIAVCLYRTYYEIVCSTMYLAEHESELDDFVEFGRLMYYEIAKDERVKGKAVNMLFPDRQELRKRFEEKRRLRGGKLLSWHGMTIEKLGAAVGMEKYAEPQIARSGYSLASRFVHGDSLTSLLLYDPSRAGMEPKTFARPTELLHFIGAGATCPLFSVLLATVDCGLKVGLTEEVDRLNAVWRRVMQEAGGIDVDLELAKLKLNQRTQSREG